MAGVDLALADGDIAKILYDLCTRGGLDDDSRTMLPLVLADLELAVPQLSEPGRLYFGTALELLRAVASDADVER